MWFQNKVVTLHCQNKKTIINQTNKAMNTQTTQQQVNVLVKQAQAIILNEFDCDNEDVQALMETLSLIQKTINA